MVRGDRTPVAAKPVAAPRREESAQTFRSGTRTPAGALLDLQRRAGNAAAMEMLRRAQPKLDVGSSDDPCEVEAETVARRVVDFLHGAPVPPADPSDEASGPVVRRASIGQAGGETDTATESAIRASEGRGAPMSGDLRTAMESAFGGTDFSSVRLHAGVGPAALNRQLSAQAFTVGSDIFFRDGLPGRDRAGHSLLAHELTHTIQQGSGQQGAGASRQVQRLFGFGKKKEQPKTPDISPFLAQQISSAIVMHPTMVQAEKLRDEGKEDEATALIEKFWDSENLLVKNEKGENRLIQLHKFKPLMFTPAEKRMLKVRKWRTAVVVKDMWDEAVRKGEVHDPNPVKEEKDDSKAVNTVGGIVDDVGTANSLAGGGSKIGDKVELYEAAKKLPKVPQAGDQSLGGKIKSGIQKEWSQSLDTHTISDSSDKKYEASKYANKSEWSEGIIGIIGQSITLVSSVVKTISLALDKKATKADVAAQIQDNLAQAAATAGTIAQAVENIQGSELTTNMFHWVPGLSIFSNGFAAIGSMVALVQKAYRVYKINVGRAKVTDKEQEDLTLAMERMWVRAAQQVEQDSFTTAKNLTNTGLAIAEVATAGGFGIPALAKAVMSTVSVIHSFGHAIADSVRAAATKTARKNYFGAKASGSAEKLIRTDPLAAAESIIGRAGEGDPTARQLLEAYEITIPGLTAPRQVVEKSTKGGVQNTERQMEYSPKDVLVYQAGLEKLMGAIAEKEQPQTMWDKIKDTVDTAIKTPGQIRDRYRQAKRVADVRNEQGYGGVKDRGAGWAIKQTIFAGDSGVKKLSETTANLINTSFIEHKTGTFGPKAKKTFNVDNETVRQQLLERIQPESILRQKRDQAKADQDRKPIQVIDPHLVPTWKRAQAMSFGELSSLVHGGRKKTAMTDGEWDVTVAVYAERLGKEAKVAVGSGTK